MSSLYVYTEDMFDHSVPSSGLLNTLVSLLRHFRPTLYATKDTTGVSYFFQLRVVYVWGDAINYYSRHMTTHRRLM